MAIQYLKIKPKHMHAIQSDNKKQQIIIEIMKHIKHEKLCETL